MNLSLSEKEETPIKTEQFGVIPKFHRTYLQNSAHAIPIAQRSMKTAASFLPEIVHNSVHRLFITLPTQTQSDE